MTTRELPLPQDVDAERSLVALLCEDWQPDASHILPGHCYDPLARAVVKCARALHARAVPVNLESLDGELRARDLIGEGKPVGSIADVSECANHLAMNETGATLAARIYTAWERRKAIRAAAVLADAAYNDNAAAWPSSRARVVRALSPSEPIASPTSWQPDVQSMQTLMDRELPAVKWSVKDLFPEGVTLLAAKAKKGKSTLMLHVSESVAGGSLALGHFETEQSDVLYLALEDNERRLQKRLRQMMRGASVPKGLHVAYEWPPLDQGGLDALDTHLEAHPAVGMIVIDTLEHVRPKRRISNGLYGDDYGAVRGLQQLAGKRQVTVVTITHLRKSPAEDAFDEINASMGLLSGVDNAIVMRTANGIVELHRRGRDYEDDTVLALKGDAKTLLWRVEGKAEEVSRSAARKEIIAALRADAKRKRAANKPEDGMSPKAIALALGKNDNTTRRLLQKLLDEKTPAIRADGNGHYHAIEIEDEPPPDDDSDPDSVHAFTPEQKGVNGSRPASGQAPEDVRSQRSRRSQGLATDAQSDAEARTPSAQPVNGVNGVNGRTPVNSVNHGASDVPVHTVHTVHGPLTVADVERRQPRGSWKQNEQRMAALGIPPQEIHALFLAPFTAEAFVLRWNREHAAVTAPTGGPI